MTTPKRRVLVADDNEDSAETLTLLLQALGNEVRAVHDGQRAVEEAEAFRPDVALLDIGMPGLDGYEAARLIRANGLEVTGLCRGGMFPAADAAGRQAALDDNRRAVDDAATLGARCLVLVVGGIVPGTRDLPGARRMVLDGIGLGRFAYTPLIPAVIEAGWASPSAAAYIGAANLAGYLVGALAALRLAGRFPVAAILRMMMVLATASFFACAWPLSESWLVGWRGVAGDRQARAAVRRGIRSRPCASRMPAITTSAPTGSFHVSGSRRMSTPSTTPTTGVT